MDARSVYVIDGDLKVEWVACGYRSQVGAHMSEAVPWDEKQSVIAADALRSGARAREVVGDLSTAVGSRSK